MTRKDYIAAARVIAVHTNVQTCGKDERDAAWDIARELASMFAADNKNFNREKFLDACGCRD